MSAQQRRSRSGFVGRLTILYRNTEALLDTGDVELVSKKIEEVEEAFLRFCRSHYEYFTALIDDRDKETANKFYNDQLQRKILFIQRMKTWVRNNRILPKDSASNVGSTTSSVAVKRIKANKALAELEVRQLRRRHEMMRQETDMKYQRELLEAQYKLEKAQLEVHIFNQNDDENGESEFAYCDRYEVNPRGIPFESEQLNSNTAMKEYCDELNENVETLHANEFEHSSKHTMRQSIKKHCHDDEIVNDDPNADYDDTNATYVINENPLDIKDEYNHNHVISKLNPDSQEFSPNKTCNAETMVMNLAHLIHLPRPDLTSFDGDPLEYYNFIRCFDNYIEKHALNESERLMYLLQYTSGDAKRIIKGCAMMEPSRGYKTARQLLKERFGHPFTIATKSVSKLTDGPPLRSSDRAGLLLFADELTNCQNILESIGYLQEINSADNLRRVVQRLPMNLRIKFVEVANNLQQRGERATIHHIATFVNQKAKAANDPVFGCLVDQRNEVRESRPVPKPRTKLTHQRATHQSFSTSTSTSLPAKPERVARSSCPACKELHQLKSCPKFAEMSHEDRVKMMRSLNLCNNCFKPGHIALGCLQVASCEVEGCTRRHHTLLHPPKNDSEIKSTPPIPRARNFNVSSKKEKKVCLRIIPVKVSGPCKSVITYALLDNGSDVSLCDKALASEVAPEGKEEEFFLTTQEKRDSPKMGQCLTNIKVESMDGDSTLKINQLLTVDNLNVSSESIPAKTEVHHWPHLRDVTLTECKDKEIKLLIGSNVPEAFWVIEERRGNAGEPYAIRSPLGWTLLGPTKTSQQITSHTSSFVRLEDSKRAKENKELLTQVQQFWKMDHAIGTCDKGMSREDKQAIQTMEGSIKLKDGHYEVGLPWKQEIPYLPNNRSLAEQRLKLLKKRFKADEQLFSKYKGTMQDYISKGHAARVPQEEVNSEGKPLWYLPHHPVFNVNKPDKTRVVFDCSAKFRNTSLNDQLLSGPDLTNSIVGVLTRFRQEEVALAADIECMYHQVRVSPADYDAFRFLWWPNNDLEQEPVDHRMVVHLFGATSSPSCSNFALRKTADDNKHNFSEEAVSTVKNNFYVDDCLKSVNSCEKAKGLANELTVMLSKGGFKLTKWSSNKPEVIESIPESERSAKVVSLDFDKERLPIERTLGLKWDMQTDQFTFDVKPKDKPATRRGILSVTSSVYDPLGFLAPVILPAKRIIQDLCRKQLDWDDRIEDNDLARWCAWKDQLPELSNLAVRRCLKGASLKDIKTAELHHFADASQYAYGAVSYLRLVDKSGKVNVAFLMGKARLAHLRPETIPRLELMAAVMATEMDKVLRQELEIHIDDSVFWTDSTSVLQYIRNTSSRFHTFVANRLTVIHERTKLFQWRYVPSELNPADDASRGITIKELCQSSKWLTGPVFLSKEKALWPAEPIALSSNQCLSDDPEVKGPPAQCLSTHASKDNEEDVLTELTKRFSSWIKLKRAVAWLTKFKVWLQNHRVCQTKLLTVDELRQAETTIIRHMQNKTYPDVTTTITTDAQQRKMKIKLKGLPSSLHGLSPVIDDQGILRVGGRIENAPISTEAKHQIILPRNNHVTELIIQAHHQECGHLGESYVLSSIRQNYWIVKGKSAVRSVLGKCIRCKRINRLPAKQMMAELPHERVKPDEPPFTSVGVDFFGPIYVRQRRSSVKRYGCLFSCLTTRAVHIEITDSLDTDSFINALRRFVNTRGNPTTIYSDNGTNLRAGEREIHKSIQDWNQHQVNKALSQRNITWKFNPPTASHMGGVWERVIRSIRKIMRAILGSQCVTDEVLRTTMSEVQGILNSRPLTPLSNDANDLEVLTPNHLLLLKGNLNLPLGLHKDKDGYTRRRWKQVQYLANVFWRRWIREFLPTLQVRQKWFGPKRNLRVGDLVLISDDNTPRGKWPLGKITEVNFGRDGLVRSARVFTRGVTLTRPVTKLCFLEHQA